MSSRLKNKEHLLKVLSKAQGERDKRQELVTCVAWWNPSKTEDIPAWCEYEQEVMLGEVNKLRDKKGLPLIGPLDIARVEAMAKGHSDYSSKFALYCAELVDLPSSEIKP